MEKSAPDSFFNYKNTTADNSHIRGSADDDNWFCGGDDDARQRSRWGIVYKSMKGDNILGRGTQIIQACCIICHSVICHTCQSTGSHSLHAVGSNTILLSITHGAWGLLWTREPFLPRCNGFSVTQARELINFFLLTRNLKRLIKPSSSIAAVLFLSPDKT